MNRKALERALLKAQTDGITVRAVMIAKYNLKMSIVFR